jgi:uncharacterized lipoprotein
MRLSSSLVRPLALVLLAVSVAGCSWFKKGAKGDYALAPEARPLEVPPDLNVPNTSGAMQVPNVGPASSSSGAGTAAAGGFIVAGSRDDAFTRVGEALGGIEGATIASRAQLLGTYDVSYEGASFLVRVSAVDAGAYVSAVDPRGLPATSPAAVKLLAALKAKLGG